MASVSLVDVCHSYGSGQGATEPAYALQDINLGWEDGGAFALLGPSGCGKTTLLNIVSGLTRPTKGQVFFDGRDVTGLTPEQRNIAQVFQFPVVYDTMTVQENLAFPLKNRGMDAAVIRGRVREIAEILDLGGMLDHRASGLDSDARQKISLGRGLVRDDVNVIMFDEPLTVIDPHLKWRLRSKLKELHARVKATMVYVTHDQTEALTFADRVVVMKDGEIVQTGAPVDLFERPEHVFVGHFIGSPGMNVLPCTVRDGMAQALGTTIRLDGPIVKDARGPFEIGIRPEHVSLVPASGQQEPQHALAGRVRKVVNLGRHAVVDVVVIPGEHPIKAIMVGQPPEGDEQVRLLFDPRMTRLYSGGRLATRATPRPGQP